MRLLHTLAALAISFVLPTFAQDTVDPQVAQQIRALASKYDEAYNRNDATAVAALYTDDAVTTSQNGTLNVGRPSKDCFERVGSRSPKRFRPKLVVDAGVKFGFS